MRREETGRTEGALTALLAMVVFALGFLTLAVRLKEVQLDSTASYAEGMARQSVCRVLTTGSRGRIVDRHGVELAANRRIRTVTVDPAAFQRRTWRLTAEALAAATAALGRELGLEVPWSVEWLESHLKRDAACSIEVWRDVDFPTFARFCERSRNHPGFRVEDAEVRVYPQGSLAAHVLGYVGRDRGDGVAGDQSFRFRELELRGRAGLEGYYDEYLRGVPGERRLRVDVRGFATEDRTVAESQAGPDLVLALDLALQQAAERELAGLKGACVVLDPVSGEVLAMASSPTYDLGDFTPMLTSAAYARLRDDPAKPLLNRASGGLYAPGSTFKPVTALAALAAGIPAARRYCCEGAFELAGMRLRCTRRWGHGELDIVDALKYSCNPYFCDLGMEVGTNRLIETAGRLGLGVRTGIDLSVDAAGVLPEGGWKAARYHERWYPGDLAQMAIGQGMTLATPLQMALVAGAIGTGRLVRPHLRRDVPVESRALPFSAAALAVVRRGMDEVVNGVDEFGKPDGTGRRGGEGLPVRVCGKTGTAEVGVGEHRRKNTWFIAYAPAEAPTVAVAMVVENGETGGSTTAPKVRNVLAQAFASATGGRR